MSSLVYGRALLLAVVCQVCSSLNPWDQLTEGLEAWAALSFDAQFAVNVGDHTGTLYTWQSENFSMSDSRLPGASLSKWPSAVMISGLVADGTMTYEDKVHLYCCLVLCDHHPHASYLFASCLSFFSQANKYLSYWSTDPKAPNSKLKLKYLTY